MPAVIILQSACAPTHNPSTEMTTSAQITTERLFSIDFSPSGYIARQRTKVESVPKLRPKNCRDFQMARRSSDWAKLVNEAKQVLQ
jgi:hypothetical protein